MKVSFYKGWLIHSKSALKRGVSISARSPEELMEIINLREPLNLNWDAHDRNVEAFQYQYPRTPVVKSLVNA